MLGPGKSSMNNMGFPVARLDCQSFFFPVLRQAIVLMPVSYWFLLLATCQIYQLKHKTRQFNKSLYFRLQIWNDPAVYHGNPHPTIATKRLQVFIPWNSNGIPRKRQEESSTPEGFCLCHKALRVRKLQDSRWIKMANFGAQALHPPNFYIAV